MRNEAGIGLVEALIALVVLSIGVLAITGISLSVGAQSRNSTWRTDQALAAQQVLEGFHQRGYAAAASRTDTVTIGNRTYVVNCTVTNPAPRVRQVAATVTHATRSDVMARTFTTRLYQPRQLPSGP